MAVAVDFASLKVLVIDDQEFVRTIVKKMLQQLGVGTVLEAQDGMSGLESVRADAPDLIICDIRCVPGRLRLRPPASRSDGAAAGTPVIMLTAHTDAATIARRTWTSTPSWQARRRRR